ncbi:MAG: T9SS type A sorting domain-containing protein, partial [bacterium]
TQTPLVRFNGISQRIVFGQLRDVMRFDFGGTAPSPNDTILGFGAYLARGIGVIHEQYYDSPFSALQGAIIDSIQYGNIVSTGEPGGFMPTELKLEQNFPNPFNSTTTIRYQLSSLTFVCFKVYDVLGREIVALINEERPPGGYSVTFDASNLASGVYFYRLIINKQAITRKMILQK